MFRNYKYTTFKYKLKVYRNGLPVNNHFITENRYLKAILKVLKNQNLEVTITDCFNNKANLENILSQLES